MIKNKIPLWFALSLTALVFSACAAEDTVSQDDFDALALLSAASGVSNAAARLELNGFWLSFTGNGTASNTIRTLSATSIGGVYSGVSQLDSGDFGGFSSCGFIRFFDNAADVMITQNPPLNGACFAGDTNKGKFFKEIWINGPTAGTYYTCSLNTTGTTTIDEALAIADTTDKSNPGTSGCGSFAWSRIEPRS
ncbi:MAG: hypothetical protein RIF32_11020 [Leptospirales bacterium]|jgi:hypothetical protein